MFSQIYRPCWRLQGNLRYLQNITSVLCHNIHCTAGANARGSKYIGVNPMNSTDGMKRSLNIEDIGHEPEYLTRVENSQTWSEIEEAEAIEDLMSQPDQRFMKEIIQQEEKKRKRVIMKIMERKYFKKPQEVNLLTWSAKEQIRYLNKEYPDEWTIDRLAESFPTSRDGIIKVLQSKYFPKTPKEIVKHDKRVMEHWLALKDGKQAGKALTGGYEVLKLDGKLETMLNAAGAWHLPMPAKPLGKLVSASGSSHTRKKEPGLFESIVKDYCEKKALREKEQNTVPALVAKQNHLEDLKIEQKQLLSGMVEDLKKQVPAHGDDAKHEIKPKKKGSLRRSSFDNTGVSINNMGVGEIDKSQTLNLLMPKSQRVEKSLSLKGNRKVQGQQYGTETDPGHPIDSGEMESNFAEFDDETVKNNSLAKYMSDASVWSGDKETVDVNLYSRGSPQGKEIGKNMFDSIVYDTPRNMDSDIQEGYIFNEKTGYQHPFGKHDPSLDNIEVPKHMKGKTIRRGKVFYDDDGEMLYKVP